MRPTREFAISAKKRSPLECVAPGVFTLPGQSVGRVYLLEAADGLTLVDTGLSARSGNLIALLGKAGHRLRDVRRVLLTHRHLDHLGGLRALQANSDIEVVTLAENAARLRGRIRTVTDGDVLPQFCGGLTVLSTPGHMHGHASFWLPGRGVLFAGDTLTNWGGLHVLPSVLQHDAEQVRADVQRLSRLEPAVICCGHGVPVTRDAALQLQQLEAALCRTVVGDALRDALRDAPRNMHASQ